MFRVGRLQIWLYCSMLCFHMCVQTHLITSSVITFGACIYRPQSPSDEMDIKYFLYLKTKKVLIQSDKYLCLKSNFLISFCISVAELSIRDMLLCKKFNVFRLYNEKKFIILSQFSQYSYIISDLTNTKGVL